MSAADMNDERQRWVDELVALDSEGEMRSQQLSEQLHTQLQDGIYIKDGQIRIRRRKNWFYISQLGMNAGNDADHIGLGWRFIAPEWRPDNNEQTELAPPPLQDGIYQKGRLLRCRRNGLWLNPMADSSVPTPTEDRHYRTEWIYLGREA